VYTAIFTCSWHECSLASYPGSPPHMHNNIDDLCTFKDKPGYEANSYCDLHES